MQYRYLSILYYIDTSHHYLALRSLNARFTSIFRSRQFLPRFISGQTSYLSSVILYIPLVPLMDPSVPPAFNSDNASFSTCHTHLPRMSFNIFHSDLASVLHSLSHQFQLRPFQSISLKPVASTCHSICFGILCFLGSMSIRVCKSSWVGTSWCVLVHSWYT